MTESLKLTGLKLPDPIVNIDAELYLIGCIINDPKYFSKATNITASHFTLKKCKHIWVAIKRLESEGRYIDVDNVYALVSETLDRDYVEKLSDSVTPAIEFDKWHEKVNDAYMRRQVVEAQKDLQAMAYNPAISLIEIEQRIHKLQDSITVKVSKSEYSHVGEIIDDVYEEIINPKGQTGLPTHIGQLNMTLGGFRNSNLYILAGLTSHGKTTLALNIAKNNAIRNGTPTLYISLELTKEELMIRLLYEEADIPNSVGGDKLTDEQKKQLNKARIKLADSPLYFIERADWHVRDMRNELRDFIKEKKIGLLIVDHLQKLNGAGVNDTRAREISDVTAGLKKLAVEMQIPVLALCQFNRQGDKRGEQGIPALSDLKDSSSIEQDAQGVLIIHQWSQDKLKSRDHKNQYKGNAVLVVAKNSHGARNTTIDLLFQGDKFRFSSIRPENVPEDDIENPLRLVEIKNNSPKR
jgi:replicative DNA helicase